MITHVGCAGLMSYPGLSSVSVAQKEMDSLMIARLLMLLCSACSKDGRAQNNNPENLCAKNERKGVRPRAIFRWVVGSEVEKNSG